MGNEIAHLIEYADWGGLYDMMMRLSGFKELVCKVGVLHTPERLYFFSRCSEGISGADIQYSKIKQ